MTPFPQEVQMIVRVYECTLNLNETWSKLEFSNPPSWWKNVSSFKLYGPLPVDPAVPIFSLWPDVLGLVLCEDSPSRFWLWCKTLTLHILFLGPRAKLHVEKFEDVSTNNSLVELWARLGADRTEVTGRGKIVAFALICVSFNEFQFKDLS